MYTMASDAGCELFAVLIPHGHIQDVTAAEGGMASHDWSPMLPSQDTVVSDCMARLAAAPHAHDTDGDIAVDETARRLILRINQLNDGGLPDCHDDSSLFGRRTLLGLKAHVDEHLHRGPALSDVGLLVWLSPRHFGKKFRRSTGLSLQRFVN